MNCHLEASNRLRNSTDKRWTHWITHPQWPSSLNSTTNSKVSTRSQPKNTASTGPSTLKRLSLPVGVPLLTLFRQDRSLVRNSSVRIKTTRLITCFHSEGKSNKSVWMQIHSRGSRSTNRHQVCSATRPHKIKIRTNRCQVYRNRSHLGLSLSRHRQKIRNRIMKAEVFQKSLSSDTGQLWDQVHRNRVRLCEAIAHRQYLILLLASV